MILSLVIKVLNYKNKIFKGKAQYRKQYRKFLLEKKARSYRTKQNNDYLP